MRYLQTIGAAIFGGLVYPRTKTRTKKWNRRSLKNTQTREKARRVRQMAVIVEKRRQRATNSWLSRSDLAYMTLEVRKLYPIAA